MECTETGHRPQGLAVDLTRTSGATVAVEGLPAGAVLAFADRDGTVVETVGAGTVDDGVTSWVLTAPDVAALDDGGAWAVNVTHGGVVLLAGRVQWHSAWSGSCGTDGVVRFVGGPPGPPGGPGVGVPTGGSVGQVLGKTGGGDFETGWVDQTGGGGGGAVDSVNGQTGDVVLDAGDVGALPASTPIPSAPADVGAAPAVHSHAIGDVTGLSGALAGKQPAGDYATRSELFSGAYSDLTGRPSIPAVPGDIGAQPAGSYVTTGDARLSDARTPLPHTHPASDVTGLATVATTGAYGDLSGTPSIPEVPQDIGAQPAGSYATGAQGALADTAVQPGDLADVATTGSYDDLTGKPTIPAAGVQSVVAGDGVTVDDTDPANPVVSTEGGGAPDWIAADAAPPAGPASANSQGATATGYRSVAAYRSVANGYYARASANRTAAYGYFTSAQHNNSVALGEGVTTNATNQVAVGPRDVEVQDPTRGYILWSPDGTRWRLTVDDNGDLSTTAL